MATIAQLNSELCIEEIPMHCQPDLGSFKCIENFYGSVSTDRAHEILQSVATELQWSLVIHEQSCFHFHTKKNTKNSFF
jgi:hypothetical protein